MLLTRASANGHAWLRLPAIVVLFVVSNAAFAQNFYNQCPNSTLTHPAQIENMVSLKLIDGYYPRLGLAPGQRFASKGGYIVRFGTKPDQPVVADAAWLVPPD
jgi:hypothetical protein